MKKYKVWTKKGNWNFETDSNGLKNLKRTYKNFKYKEIKTHKRRKKKSTKKTFLLLGI